MLNTKLGRKIVSKLNVKQKNNIKWKQFVAVYLFALVSLLAISLLTNRGIEHFWLHAVIQILATALLLISLCVYEYFADGKVIEHTRNSLAIVFTMIVSYALIKLSTLISGQAVQTGIYLVPFSLCALVLTLIVSSKSAFFANFAVIMLYYIEVINFANESAVASESSFYLLFSGVAEAVFAAFVLGKHYNRVRYLLVGLALGVLSAVCAIISFAVFVESSSISFAEVGIKASCAVASGIINIMFMFVLVPLFERIFDVTSAFRFSEIATSDNKLMRKLFERAPGTYNHSMTVAIYAEACAVAIGESAVLARCAAYYHDIGKIKNPSYFSENQLSGKNPHDSLSPESSVSLIRSHPINGIAIAKEYGLPLEVQLAIIEHHGTMPIKYFYLKAQKYTDGELSVKDYRYKCPKPTNKISAILMICDACEAALRANADKGNTEKIVDDIVAERFEFDQFSDCDITIKEIETIKNTIITTYSGIKHDRVVYPDVQLEDKQDDK